MSGNSFWGSLTSGLSNFADGVGDFFNVDSTVSTSSNIKPDDVLKTKTALSAVGSYNVPDFGITGIPDTGMIDGLKNFQANNGLKVDGVMKPGGPTENALGQTLANQGISTTDMMEKVKTPSITPMPDMPKPVSPPQTSWSASAPLGEVPKPSRPKLPKIDPMTGLEDPLASAPKGKMPTKKQWEEVAKIQHQKAKTAIIPLGDTVDQRIRSMMSDKRYGDKHDTRLREHVQKQFQNAYPGNLEYDETGKMIQPTAAIRPQDVEPFDPDSELKSMEMFNDQNEETVAQGYGLQSTDRQDTPAQTTDAKPIHFFGKDGKPKSVIDKGDGTFVDLNGQPVADVPDWVTRRDDKTGQVQVASNSQTMNDASPDANDMFPVKDPSTGKEYQVDMNGNYYDDSGEPVSLSDDVQQRLNNQFANDTDDEIDETSEKLPQDHSHQSDEESKFNPDDFADSLSDNAESKSKGRCAAYVRRALEAGGLDSSGHPRNAKDWGPTLEKNGFVPVDPDNYVPQKGDVVVIQPYPGGNKAGHMAAYSGNQWISDFKQRDMWAGPGYRKHKPPHVIYRKMR